MVKRIARYEYFLLLLTLCCVLMAGYYADKARDLQTRFDRAAVIEHEGKGEWIMIRHKGEVVSEWQPKDGKVYEVLDEALHAK